MPFLTWTAGAAFSSLAEGAGNPGTLYPGAGDLMVMAEANMIPPYRAPATAVRASRHDAVRRGTGSVSRQTFGEINSTEYMLGAASEPHQLGKTRRSSSDKST